jgi:hypothetical protein
VTGVLLSAVLLLAAVLTAGAVGERRRRADYGRLSKRHVIKYH